MTKEIVTIHFETTLVTIGKFLVARIPENESVKLPSRGQISVTGTINGHKFKTVLEPDGYWSHWFKITDDMQTAQKLGAGDTIHAELTPTKIWPEPDVPADFAKALATAPQKVKDKWRDITPMARWEWIRWVNATASSTTRTIRIEKSISKLSGKHRRPCCFNLAACTDPDVSKNGRLIEPTHV